MAFHFSARERERDNEFLMGILKSPKIDAEDIYTFLYKHSSRYDLVLILEPKHYIIYLPIDSASLSLPLLAITQNNNKLVGIYEAAHSPINYSIGAAHLHDARLYRGFQSRPRPGTTTVIAPAFVYPSIIRGR